MHSTIRKLLLLCLAVMLALPAAVAAAPVADGPNLLDNPGFESPYVKQCCQTDLSIYLPNTPIGEVQVAEGWSGWWLQPDLDPQHPSAGGHPSWHRPEWREANCGSTCANRIHSGGNAQKYFTFFSVHDAGMFQQVSGIAPGTRLRFSVYMQGWSTNADYGLSDFNQNMGMRIGIDPFGGTDAFSPNVIWTAAHDVFDAWGLYVMEATARAGTVTVFTRSAPGAGNQHNDIYIDDASLVAVTGGGTVVDTNDNPPPPPAPTATEITGLRYTVVRGDNYYRISRRFGVSLSLLYQANRVTNPNVLYVGTVLIIPGVTGPVDLGGGNTAPLPTQAPEPTVAPQDLPGAFSYVVVRGDNLYRLSLRFGVSIDRIKQLNNLVSNMIFIGQTLIIAP